MVRGRERAPSPRRRRPGRPIARVSSPRLVLLLVLASLALDLSSRTLVASAQEAPRASESAGAPNGATGPQAAEATPPAFVEVPRIPARTEALTQTLGRLAAAAAANQGVSGIETELPELQAQNRDRAEQTRRVLLDRPTLDRLTDLDRDWSSRLGRLDGWRQSLTRRAAELETELAELRRLREVWTATLENARATEAPAELLHTVETNLTAIESTRGVVRERRAAVLALLTRVSDEDQAAGAVRAQIATARAELRGRLLEPDAAPVWSVREMLARETDEGGVGKVLTEDWRVIEGFVETNLSSAWPLLLFFGVAVGLTLRLRRGVRRRASSPQLEGSAGVVERPYSVAIVLTLLVLLLSFPFMPVVVRNTVGLVLLLPLMRLLTPLVSKDGGPALWALGSLYVIDRLRELLAPAVVLERVAFLVETVVASVLVVLWLRQQGRLRPSGNSTAPGPNAQTTAVQGLHLAAALLALSSLGNLFGYVGFARYAGEGTLGALYLALVAYAAYRIGTTFLVLAVTSDRMGRVAVVRKHADRLLTWGRRTQILTFGILWVLWTLDGFALRGPVTEALFELLSTSREIGTVSISIGDVLAFPLTIFLAVTLSRAIRTVLEDEVYPRVELQRGVPNAISTSLHYLLLLTGFVLALGAAGIDLGRFSLLAGALGVGIGFGLQTVVNNFVSGLILLFERPIQVGDVIELNELLGTVKQIGIRASVIVTFQGAEVIVPNGNLLAEQLINWTLSNTLRRVDLAVGVSYSNRPVDVIRVLQSVLEQSEDVVRDPAPNVLFRGFGDSSLNFEVRFWALNSNFLRLQSDIASRIYDALAAAGIEIPFPQRDLHLRSVDEGVLEDVATRLRGGPGQAGMVEGTPPPARETP